MGAKDTDPESVTQQTFDPLTLNPLLRASQLYREWDLTTSAAADAATGATY